MSRGGRGGGWGGGGGAPNAAGKMGGQALPWDWDPELEGKLSSKPSEKFPPQAPPYAEPPTSRERRIVAHHRTLRGRIHDGPFYTVLDSGARVSKSHPGRAASPPTAHFDPFEGAETYSQRFVRKRNTLPRLSTRPFVKELFPRELWETLDPGGTNGKDAAEGNAEVRKKGLLLHTKTKEDRWAAFTKTGDAENGDGGEGGEEDAEDGAEDEEEKEGEDEAAEEDDPDQFDEEDEDMDDDYNAENYFDGGDDDDYGGDEGGGGGDDDNY